RGRSRRCDRARRRRDRRSGQQSCPDQPAAAGARPHGGARISARVMSDVREGHADRQAREQSVGAVREPPAPMRTIKLVVQYDGSDFVGWQRQGKGVSVQGLIEEALATIDGAPVTLHGAGRTDAGVHAIGQVASARMTSPIEDWQLVRALNAHLPKSIRVTELTTVPDAFHARFSATAKTYEYRIWNGRTMPPFLRQYAWHVIEPLDLPPMQQASQAIPGEHDFAAFRSARSMNHTTVREITSAGWRRE